MGSICTVSGRYSAVLFDLAQRHGKLDAVRRGVSLLLDVLQDSSLLRYMSSPVFDFSFFSVVLSEDQENGKEGSLLLAFLDVVFRYKRLSELTHILEEFIENANRALGSVCARVEVAASLSDSSFLELRDTLRQYMASPHLEIEVVVNPSLLAGFSVFFEGKVIDFSLLSALEKFRLHLEH